MLEDSLTPGLFPIREEGQEARPVPPPSGGLFPGEASNQPAPPGKWPVVGHQAAIEVLQRSIYTGRLGHAYLLHGPPQVGKTTLARAFAQALNCTTSYGTPCGECRACRLIARGVHPDVRSFEMLSVEEEEQAALEAEEQGERHTAKTRISIEDIREQLIRDASLLPYEARYKVYTIVGAENLSEEAADAILKTLEEPPAHVVLILTAPDPRLLHETVVSRCQQMRLGLVPVDEIEAFLVERQQVQEDDARLLARVSSGRAGWAIAAASQPALMEERRQALDWMAELPGASRRQRFEVAEDLANEFRKSRGKVAIAMQYWVGWWRDVILARLGCGHLMSNIDYRGEIEEQASHLILAQARAGLRAVEEASANLRANVNPRLALEALMLALPRL